MKKIISIILSLALVLSFTACGTKGEADWKEQYDLGMKYVNESKVEEAILAFSKSIELDPKQIPPYIALAEIYVWQENYTAADETLDKAVAEIGETDELLTAKSKLEDIKTARSGSDELTVEEVPGVTETSRVDWSDGTYSVYGYDADDNTICIFAYDTEGRLELYQLNTFDAGGNLVREDVYSADGVLRLYGIHTYDANGNSTGSTYYTPDGSVIE
ncbi:MAG: hypothetical protein IJ410_05230 [Oscillospiraceae bacterium]|nr:hypothetical protein [Oscillospiraceae bacterium]